MPAPDADILLIARIRQGDQSAWAECINRFEGRLLAFVNSRLHNRATSEDVVQETFVAFLISLPNYYENSPLEAFLFSIAAHKLTDVLRRQGRRPALPLLPSDSDGPGGADLAGSARPASSLARSKEDRNRETRLLEEALRVVLDECFAQQDFMKLKCLELLFVAGWPNKTVALSLGLSEQAVANTKFATIAKLREFIRRAAGRTLQMQLGDDGIARDESVP